MLVDVTPRGMSAIEPIAQIVAQVNGRAGESLPRRLAQGIWEFRSWNPEYEIVEKLEDNYSFEGPDYPKDATEEQRGDLLRAWFAEDNAKRDARYALYLEKYGIEVVGEYEDDLPPVAEGVRRQVGINDHYGVCDSPEQLLEHLPHLAEDPEAYMVAMVEIRRDRQSDRGGWRWHKWGPYIGTQNPQHEYLYDEKHIDSVFTYHVYRVVMSADEVLTRAGYRLIDQGNTFLVVYGKGQESHRLGAWDRQTAIAQCYAHNANLAEVRKTQELEEAGYTFDSTLDPAHIIVAFDGVEIGTAVSRQAALNKAHFHNRARKKVQADG